MQAAFVPLNIEELNQIVKEIERFDDLWKAFNPPEERIYIPP